MQFRDRPDRRDRGAERGSAVIWALIVVTLISGMIVSHSTYMSANRKALDVRYRRIALSREFAQSGLSDTLTWLRGQPQQPVTRFTPQRRPDLDPPLMDTLDPTLGLVREFEVRGGLWGRYEVRRDQVEDISEQRGVDQPGRVWDVGALGILYKRVDPTKPFNEEPNIVLSRSSLRTEMRGIPVNPPASAAVLIDAPDGVTLGENGTIDGGARPGIAHRVHSAHTEVPAEVTGNVSGKPATVGLQNFSTDSTRVFGMRLDQLKSLSDIVIDSHEAIPKQVDGWRVMFVDRDLTLRSGEGLTGNMLLVVKGDLTAEDGNGSKLSGMVVVTGNATIAGPFDLSGSIVVGGKLAVGKGALPATIRHEATAMAALRNALKAYRMSRMIRPGANVKPGRTQAKELLVTAKVRLAALQDLLPEGKDDGKDKVRKAQEGMAEALSFFTSGSQVSDDKAFGVLEEDVADKMKDLAKLVKDGKVDAAALPYARSIAMLATEAARVLAEAALATATADDGADRNDIADAERKLRQGDAAALEPEDGFAKKGIEWYHFAEAIEKYKGSWKESRAAVDR